MPQPAPGPPVTAALALLGLLAGAPPGQAAHALRTLSADFAPGGVISTIIPLASADGRWVVFEGCDTANGPCWLASAPRFLEPGTAPIQLTGPIYSTGSSTFTRLTADSRRVVFLAADAPGDPEELWSVPIDGSAAPARLHPPLVAGQEIGRSVITHDGQQVVFAIHDGMGSDRLVRTAADGSGGNVTLDLGNIGELVLFPPTAGGPRVLYLLDTDGDDRLELRTVTLDGASPQLPTAVELRVGAIITGIEITADGSRAALLSDLDTVNVSELYALPLGGTGATYQKLNQALPGGGDIERLELSATGRAVFSGDAEIDERRELWSVPVDASAAPVKLSGTLVAGGDVEFGWELAGDWVVYLADAQVDTRTELWSAPVAGGSAPTRRSDTVPAGRDVTRFRVAANGTRLVYRANLEQADRFDLYRTTVSGITSHVRLTNLNVVGPDPYDVYEAFALSPDSERVVFATLPDVGHNGQVREQRLVDPAITPEVLVTAHGSNTVVLNPRYALGDAYGVLIIAALDDTERREVHLMDERVFADGFETGNVAAWSAVPSSSPIHAATRFDRE